MKTCTNCGKINDAHSPVDGVRGPKDGDLSICAYCGTICQFDKELNLLPLSSEAIGAIQKEDPKAYRILMTAARVIKSQIQKN